MTALVPLGLDAVVAVSGFAKVKLAVATTPFDKLPPNNTPGFIAYPEPPPVRYTLSTIPCPVVPPLAAPLPEVTVTAGAERYPEPPLETTYPVTLPVPSMVAVAAAPDRVSE